VKLPPRLTKMPLKASWSPSQPDDSQLSASTPWGASVVIAALATFSASVSRLSM
jgi:hypothetical protein